jgi:carbon starvation protein
MRASFGRVDNHGASFVATGLIVAGFTYFILTGSISTIWPMFGIANQLLACAALCVGTTILLREGRERRYALITLLPLAFLSVTTFTAGVESIRTIYIPMSAQAATRTTGLVNVIVTSFLLAGVTVIILGSARRWLRTIRTDTPLASAG